MEVKRKSFQGVLNILSFNRHFYVFGLGVLALLIASNWFFNLQPLVFWLIIIAFLYGLIMPLIVSAYVYDFSGYYKLDWLQKEIKDADKIKLSLNINAGFDETSFIIERIFPNTQLMVFDFYNAKQHTEPAIKRARKVSLVYPNTQQILANSIPLEDKTVDAIFLLSALHEIRTQDEKIQFLKECHRVCKQDGKVIMVTHFFSRSIWKKAFEGAGFTSFKETKFTPFMSIFNCSK